jgi:N-hydroxyarylamine O-acetyltransferase
VPDLDALLDRIGLPQLPPPTLAGLQTLHRAYVTAIPYEDLAVQLEEFDPLDVDTIAKRLLHGGRGGYCFELNTVLAWLLEQAGFALTRHQGVVGRRELKDPPSPTNHVALAVDLPEGRYLADAGLGEGQLEAIPLRPGRYGTPRWLAVDEEPTGWWLTQNPWGSFIGVRIAAAPATLDDSQPHHHSLSTDPESTFVQTLVVQRPFRDHVETLRSRTLTTRGPDVDTSRTLADADDFARTLDERFGIDPNRLGPERIARLWHRAQDQHDRWRTSAVDPVR